MRKQPIAILLSHCTHGLIVQEGVTATDWRMAMCYGFVYVACVAMSADKNQVLKAKPTRAVADHRLIVSGIGRGI